MSRLIVEVKEITEVQEHPKADAMDLVIVGGWQCCVKKEQYKAGDKIIFIPPDALLPVELAEKLGVRNYLVGSNKNRVKSVRLRGEMSFGLIIDIPKGKDWDVGYDCMEDLGIVKYEPPMRASAGDAAPSDPYFEKYTDIENIRNFNEVFEKEEMVVITEKIDGSNQRCGWQVTVNGHGETNIEWKAGSHRLKRKQPSGEEMTSNIYWYPLTLEPVKNLLEDLFFARNDNTKTVTLYGEVYGRVRGGHKSLHYGRPNELAYVAFDISIDGKFQNYNKFKEICDYHDVPTAPLIAEMPFDWDKVKKLSQGDSVLASQNKTKHMREGVIVKPVKETTHPKIGRKILKVINDDYILLKNKAYEKGEVTDYTDI